MIAFAFSIVLASESDAAVCPGIGIVGTGLAARLKPDTSAPVPKGFTQAIERMRRGQQDKEEAQRFWDQLGRGIIDKKVRLSVWGLGFPSAKFRAVFPGHCT
jgi:hypothetical protein